MDGPRAPGGALASLNRLAATLFDALATRIELAIVELREEGERRKALLILAVMGGVFLGMGLLLGAFFVVVLFWDSHRLIAIGGVTLIYLGIGVAAFLRMRWIVRTAPQPFETTLKELAADRDMLRGRRE